MAFSVHEYKKLAEISDLLLLRLDNTGRVSACSESTARILGYSETELVGQNWFETCLPSISREATRLIFQRVVNGEINPFESYQNEVVTRSGELRMFSFANHWARDSSGKITGVLCSGFDVTDARAARELAEAFENRLESLFRIAKLRAPSIKDLLAATLQEAVTLTGSTMGYLYFYDEATKEFTLNCRIGKVMDQCQVVGANVRYALDATGVWGDAVRQRRAILINDYSLPNPHAKGLPVGHVPIQRFLTIPVFSGDRIAAVVGVANKELPYDVSDERQLLLLTKQAWSVVEEQEKENREAEFRESLVHSEKLALVGTMAAGIAHEMNTPLAVLEALIEEARYAFDGRANASEVFRESLPAFESALQKLLSLSQTLTSFCRHGKTEEKVFEPVDMHVLIGQSLVLLNPLVKKRGVLIRTELHENPCFVKVDAGEIQQIFLNLVKNACDAMEGQSETSEVVISTRVERGNVCVRFQDSGPGIPEELREKIFAKFFTTKPVGKGTGLGLSICVDIAKRAQGSLQLVHSSSGAAFELVLPAV
jgi:PAS domain S-box-containing protein